MWHCECFHKVTGVCCSSILSFAAWIVRYICRCPWLDACNGGAPSKIEWLPGHQQSGSGQRFTSGTIWRSQELWCLHVSLVRQEESSSVPCDCLPEKLLNPPSMLPVSTVSETLSLWFSKFSLSNLSFSKFSHSNSLSWSFLFSLREK